MQLCTMPEAVERNLNCLIKSTGSRLPFSNCYDARDTLSTGDSGNAYAASVMHDLASSTQIAQASKQHHLCNALVCQDAEHPITWKVFFSFLSSDLDQLSTVLPALI